MVRRGCSWGVFQNGIYSQAEFLTKNCYLPLWNILAGAVFGHVRVDLETLRSILGLFLTLKVSFGLLGVDLVAL